MNETHTIAIFALCVLNTMCSLGAFAFAAISMKAHKMNEGLWKDHLTKDHSYNESLFQ